VAAANVIESAEATGKPARRLVRAHCLRLAFRDTDPVIAVDAFRRGLGIAQNSGNPFTESILALNLALLEAERADPLAALDHITLAIRNYHDSGNTSTMRSPLAVLGRSVDGLGAMSRRPPLPVSRLVPSPHWRSRDHHCNRHLRDVLGDQTYESLPAR